MRFTAVAKAFGFLLLFPLMTQARTKSHPVIVSKNPSPLLECANEQRDRARRTLLADRIPLQSPEQDYIDDKWSREQTVAQAGNNDLSSQAILLTLALARQL